MPLKLHAIRRARSAARVRSAIAALALTSALAAPAAATNYYLSPTGSDGNAGTSGAAPWATFSKANSTVKAGDVVFVANGTYTGAPLPAVSGSANARITYVGNLANPSAVVVAGSDINRSYVTIKGMKFNNGITLVPASSAVAQYDSIAWCVLPSVGFNGAKHCFFGHNTVVHSGSGAMNFLSSNGDQSPTGFANCEYDTVRGNTFTISNIPTDGRGMIFGADTQRCLMDSNTVTATFSGSSYVGRAYVFRLLQAMYNKFTDNSFTVSALNQNGGQPWAMSCLRDSSSHNQFIREHYSSTGSYSIEFFGSESGNSQWSNDVRQNKWDHCRWDIRTPLPDTYWGVYWQDGVAGDTIQYCVVNNSSGPGIMIPYVRNFTPEPGVAMTTVIDHNTIYTPTSNGWGPLTLDTPSGNWGSGTSMQITNNIFYTGASNTGATWYAAYDLRVPTGVNLRSDHNLVTHYAGASKSIWYQVGGGSTGYTQPGSSGWTCLNGTSSGFPAGLDCASRYGSPQFQDSSRATFDPHLGSASAARGLATDGGDVGAFPYTVVGPDVTPPATIGDLHATFISDQVVILAWTAPGDDGAAGTASGYDLRWSNSPITAANFTAATPVIVQPIPIGAGGGQSYIAVSLVAGTSYYWAIKARDEASNWSSLGAVPQTVTRAADSISPKATTDLAGN